MRQSSKTVIVGVWAALVFLAGGAFLAGFIDGDDLPVLIAVFAAGFGGTVVPLLASGKKQKNCGCGKDVCESTDAGS